MVRGFVFSVVFCSLGSTFVSATDAPVTAIVFSPDGKQVVVGSQNGLVVKNWPSLKTSQNLETALLTIHDLRFSPDGKFLLAAGGDPAETGEVELYSWPKKTLVQSKSFFEDVVYSVSWQNDSLHFFAGSLDASARLISTEKMKTLRTFRGHSKGIRAVVCLGDRRWGMTAGEDQTIRVWNLKEGTMTRSLSQHAGTIYDLALKPKTEKDAQPMIASAGADRTVRFWQPTIGRMVRFCQFKRSVPMALAWTTEGDTLFAACKDGKVYAIDPETAEIRKSFAVSQGWIYCIVRHPSQNRFLLGDSSGKLLRLDDNLRKRSPRSPQIR